MKKLFTLFMALTFAVLALTGLPASAITVTFVVTGEGSLLVGTDTTDGFNFSQSVGVGETQLDLASYTQWYFKAAEGYEVVRFYDRGLSSLKEPLAPNFAHGETDVYNQYIGRAAKTFEVELKAIGGGNEEPEPEPEGDIYDLVSLEDITPSDQVIMVNSKAFAYSSTSVSRYGFYTASEQNGTNKNYTLVQLSEDTELPSSFTITDGTVVRRFQVIVDTNAATATIKDLTSGLYLYPAALSSLGFSESPVSTSYTFSTTNTAGYDFSVKSGTKTYRIALNCTGPLLTVAQTTFSANSQAPVFYKLRNAGGDEPTPGVESTTFTINAASTAALWKDVDGTPEKVQDLTNTSTFDFKAEGVAADAKYYIVAEGSNTLTSVKDDENADLTINAGTAAFNDHNYVEIVAGEASKSYTITTASTLTSFSISPSNSRIKIYKLVGDKVEDVLGKDSAGNEIYISASNNKFDFASYNGDDYFCIVPEANYVLTSVTNADNAQETILRNANYFKSTNYVTFQAKDASKSYIVTMARGEYITIAVNVSADSPQVKLYRYNGETYKPTYKYSVEAPLEKGTNTLSIQSISGVEYAIGTYGDDILASVKSDDTDFAIKAPNALFSEIPASEAVTSWVDLRAPANGASYTVRLTRDDLTSTITVNQDNAVSLYGWNEAEGKYTEVKALNKGENTYTFDFYNNYALVAAENKKFAVVTNADNNPLTVTLPTAEGALFSTEYVVLEAGKLSTAYNVEFAAGGIDASINVNKADAVVLYVMDMDTREFSEVKTFEKGENHFTFNDNTTYAFVAADEEYFTQVTANGEIIPFVNPEEETDPVFTTTYVILQAGAIAENYGVTVFEILETTEAHEAVFDFTDQNLYAEYYNPTSGYATIAQGSILKSPDSNIEISANKIAYVYFYNGANGYYVTGYSGSSAEITIKTANEYAYLSQIEFNYNPLNPNSPAFTAKNGEGYVTDVVNYVQTWTADAPTAVGGPAYAPASTENRYQTVTFSNDGTAYLKGINVSYFDVTTGIETVESVEMVEAKYYDLQGRRVLRPTSGIYVRVAGNKVDKVAIR